jgi:AraC-like DNA-binding protein
LAFVREHLSEAQGLTDHARTASLSTYHFHRVFKSVTGVTPGRFLTSLRLAEAKRLLLYSSMSASCIGQFVGHLSPGTFTTQLTRRVGLPPRRFRVAGRTLGGTRLDDEDRTYARHPGGFGKMDERIDEARDRFDEIAQLMTHEGASRGVLFGKPCLKYGGKAFACLFRDAVAFKLRLKLHADALALEGAQLFDPSGRGRPMKEWVQVPVDHADSWPELARSARNAVGT